MIDTAAIRRREQAATAGPWHIEHPGPEYAMVRHEGEGIILLVGTARQVNAEFAAHARTDIPALLAEVERLRTEFAELKAALHDLTVSTDGDDLDDAEEIPVGEIRRVVGEAGGW